MKLQVLVSTMNQTDIHKLVKDMGIKSAIVINQITEKIDTPKDITSEKLCSVSVKERGLSKSRNRAIALSNADICLIADDDMYYLENYENIVADAYRLYQTADIIAFYVGNDRPGSSKIMLKKGRVRFIKSMRISSVQISFKKSSLSKAGIAFNETFGAGTDNYMGEENILLSESIKNGLKIYFFPVEIARLSESESTWFKGYNNEYLSVKGKVFYNLSIYMWPVLVFQFAVRKRELFSPKSSVFRNSITMLKGGWSEWKK